MRLYNTLTRGEEPFAPSADNTVRMYTCGLTVYARGHIGNFRTFVCLDVLRRTLKYLCGHQVQQVMNFTDVDDRTITGAQKAGMDLRGYTDRYIAAFREDTRALGLEEIEAMPRATDEPNLRAMADMIAALERNGHTYRSDGSIYFKISTFPEYGKLAGIDLVFPHHENEIAQSEGATGKPFSHFWVHVEYLIVDEQKMSKSLGNTYTIPDVVEKGFRPSAVRYLLLSAHYRKQLNFTWESLGSAEKALQRLTDCLARLDLVTAPGSHPNLAPLIARAREAFAAALRDDLNTAAALGAVFELVSAVNAAIDTGEVGLDEVG